MSDGFSRRRESDRLLPDDFSSGKKRIAQLASSSSASWGTIGAIAVSIAVALAALVIGSVTLGYINNGFTTPMISTHMLNVDQKANFTDASFNHTWSNTSSVSVLSVVLGVFQSISSVVATITSLTSTNATIVSLSSTTASISSLTSTNATVGSLTSTTASISSLTSTNATVGSLSSASASITALASNMITINPLTYTSSANINTSYNLHLLSGGSAINLTLPTDMSPMIGKRMKICSTTGKLDLIVLGTGNFWTADPYWSVIRSDLGSPKACVTFDVLTATKLDIVERTSSVFCNNATQYHCIDPLRPFDTNPFHGWWRLATKGVNTASSTIRPVWAFLNMTVNPVRMVRWSGLVNVPREAKSSTTLFAISPTILSTVNTQNVVDDGSFPTLYHLQTGSTQLVVYFGFQFSFAHTNGIRAVLTKVTEREVPYVSVPNFLTSVAGPLPDISPYDPRYIFKYMVQQYLITLPKVTASFGSDTFLGYEAAKKLEQDVVTVGKTHSTNIVSTLITHPNSYNNPSELVTVFRTDVHHRVSPASLVTISGFTGSCVGLNGVFKTVYQLTSSKTASSGVLYEDFGASYLNRTLHHQVGVFLNSTGIPTIGSTNYANCTGSTPIITVTYGPITAASNYIETHSAIQYWFYETFKIGLHSRINLFLKSSSGNSLLQLVDTWEDLKTRLLAGTVTTLPEMSSRYENSISIFYAFTGTFGAQALSNGRTAGQTNDLSGRFGIRQDIESKNVITNGFPNTGTAPHYTGSGLGNLNPAIRTFNYLIHLNNYVVNAVYPTWRLIGTSRSHPENLGAQTVYPGGGGDEFDTKLISMGTQPPLYYNYLFSGAAGLYNDGTAYEALTPMARQFYQQSLYAGLINPTYTQGRRIGIICLPDMLSIDAGRGMLEPQFCPTGKCNATSPRFEREALVSVYATIMKYLKVNLTADSIIIDMRWNGGGLTETGIAWRELFGTEDQQIFNSNLYPRAEETGYGTPININTFTYANDVLRIINAAETAYPSLTASNYPGSVHTGGPVIMMTDYNAGSAGDVFPNLFLGSTFNKQLGGATPVKIVGNIDGRLDGASVTGFTTPIATESNRLTGTTAPITTGIDGIRWYRRTDGSFLGNRHPALAVDTMVNMTGLSGSKSPVADWENLVYPDLGFVTNTRPRLTGDTRPQTPTVLDVVNPLSVVSGSNVVTVTTVSPHGFVNGDDVALNAQTNPVANFGGLNGVSQLTGGHIITVTGATTFTFTVSTNATSTISGGGGTIQVKNRSQWRDAWLEGAIMTAISIAPGSKREAPEQFQEEAPKQFERFSPEKARSMYGRDVICAEGLHLTSPYEMEGTETFTVNVNDHDAIIDVKRKVNAIIGSELQTGGMCLDQEGRLMATPTCTQNPKVQIIREE